MEPRVRFDLLDALTPDELREIEEALEIIRILSQPVEEAVRETLGKAVAAHPSHVAQRDRHGRFLRFNPRREQPRDTRGRFVKRLTGVEREAARELASVEQSRYLIQMQTHLGDLRARRLPADEAAKRGARAIEEYYERIFRHGMQAAGNPGILLSPRDRSALSRIVRDEQDYWRRFCTDVAAGRGRVEYESRVVMYGNAAQEAFWLGWVFGDMRPTRRIRWVMGATEHCETCQKMAAMGAMSPEQFLRVALSQGFLPQSGYLECRGIHCRCRLEEEE